MGASWQQALMVATTVLIITCPCALALAIPAVQVAASSALFRRGILLKSADALERLAQIDTVFFDKTGTLTRGTPEWRDDPWLGAEDRQAAAQLAAHSHHVLAKALSRAIGAPARTFDNIQEIPGLGIEAMVNGVRWRLGRRTWCGDGTASGDEMELWFQRSDAKPIRFAFHDALRPDARAAVAAVRAMGLSVALLSGDRDHVARSVGNLVGIENVAADLLPRDKVMRLEAALASGHRALMVGDGLNDAPALTAAHASMSPSSGIDIAQNAADLVFQGAGLHAVPLALATARKARHLVRQNLAAAIGYNLCALPIAISGQVTPLIAALAMSSSSLIVILNALRAGKLDAEPTDQALPLPTRARLKEKLA